MCTCTILEDRITGIAVRLQAKNIDFCLEEGTNTQNDQRMFDSQNNNKGMFLSRTERGSVTEVVNFVGKMGDRGIFCEKLFFFVINLFGLQTSKPNFCFRQSILSGRKSLE